MREEKYCHAEVLGIIPAAGSGSRMGVEGGKLLLDMLGKTVIRRTCESFEASPYVDAYVVVAAPASLEIMNEELHDFKTSGKCRAIIAGGERRQDSVFEGLRFWQIYLDRHSDGLFSRQGVARRVICLIHDGARCLLEQQLIEKAVNLIYEQRCGAAPALASVSTVRILDQQGRTLSSPPRSQVVLMQTPQGADLEVMLAAYNAVIKAKSDITDDIQALEYIGYPVRFFAGERNNIKLTTPHDLALAKFYLSSPPPPEV